MKRRFFMRTGVTGPLALAAGPAIAQAPTGGGKTYVLVPGTWCGGWFMKPVAEELRDHPETTAWTDGLVGCMV